jgi:hypothetical protein
MALDAVRGGYGDRAQTRTGANQGCHRRHGVDVDLGATGHGVACGLLAAPVGDVEHVDLRHLVESLAHQVRNVLRARGGERDLAGPRLGVGHQLVEVLHGHSRVDGDHHRVDAHADDGVEILLGVEAWRLEQELVHHHRRRMGEPQRVAVGCRARRRLRTDVAAGTGPVVHHHALPPHGAQLIPKQAGNDVWRTAGGRADDDPHGLFGPGLRGGGQGELGQEGQRGSDHGVHQIAAVHVHVCLRSWPLGVAVWWQD